MQMAAAKEQPAVTHTTWMGSRTASRIPASAGPPRNARLKTVCRSEAILSSETPLVRLTRPIRVSRAVIPGTSNKAPRTPSAMNQAMSSPKTWSTTASPATETALPRSESTLIRRWPTLSISQPPTSAARIAGRAAKAATNPVTAGSPVRLSTSHGRTMPIAEFPNREKLSAATNRGSEAREVMRFMVEVDATSGSSRFASPRWIEPRRRVTLLRSR